MRVSVVATGIDATDVNSELPVPRRSLREPLKQNVEVEDVAHAAPKDVEEAPRHEPAAARQPEHFEDVAAQRAPQEDPRQRAARDEAGDDGLPPPAYQPKVAQFEPRAQSIEADEQGAEAYAAPKAPAPGTPTPEALARLHAATQRQRPEGQAPRQPQLGQRRRAAPLLSRAPRRARAARARGSEQAGGAGLEPGGWRAKNVAGEKHTAAH